MSSLTIADVERIAALAHLELTDDEKPLFTRQLADILDYAAQLQARERRRQLRGEWRTIR
jgi:aspartyl/glutamyl-tRNA(Asn/Gln) amidotransferase C subunit